MLAVKLKRINTTANLFIRNFVVVLCFYSFDLILNSDCKRIIRFVKHIALRSLNFSQNIVTIDKLPIVAIMPFIIYIFVKLSDFRLAVCRVYCKYRTGKPCIWILSVYFNGVNAAFDKNIFKFHNCWIIFGILASYNYFLSYRLNVSLCNFYFSNIISTDCCFIKNYTIAAGLSYNFLVECFFIIVSSFDNKCNVINNTIFRCLYDSEISCLFFIFHFEIIRFSFVCILQNIDIY